jgi:hypothetical protein
MYQSYLFAKQKNILPKYKKVASLATTEQYDTLTKKLLPFVISYIIRFRIFLCWTLLLNNEIVIMMTTIMMIAIEEERKNSGSNKKRSPCKY